MSLYLTLALALAFAALPAPARGPSTLGAPWLPSIPEIRSYDGVATMALRAALDADGRPTFFWRGTPVAPTLRVRPGDLIRVRYENALPQFCGLGMISDSNLHFHGLTGAPKSPGDEVILTSVAPHTTFDYTIKIDRREPPGLYWYHPHPHGLANWELGNGMAGAIVVEGIADTLADLAGLRERVIVLRDIPRDPSVAAAESPARLRPQRTLGRAPASSTAADRDDIQGGAACGVDSDAQTTINGVPNASLGIAPNERQLWRILNASAHRHFDLTIPGVRMQLVAQDGVPLAYYAGAAQSRSVDHVLIPPGGRAEVVVRGPMHPQLLLAHCFDAGKSGDPNPGALFGELVDDRRTTAAARVAAPMGLRKGRENSAYSVALPAPSRKRVIHFDEDAHGFSIDRTIYRTASRPALVARAGTIEEWTLENTTDEVHVFHIHQTHFVVERTREWRDVVDLPPHSRQKVLVDFRNPVIRGTFLFHCHLADHEDGGMMAKIRVI